MTTTRAMVVALGGLAGALFGLLPVLGAWAGLPISMEVIALVGAPGARLVSWLTGWPLEQEAGLACLAIGFAITPPLVLAPLGAVVATLLPLGGSGDPEH